MNIAERRARIVSGRAVAAALDGLAPGCRVFGLTDGRYSLVDLVEGVLRVVGPADLTIATWTAGGEDAERLGRLLQSGAVGSLRLVVDRSFRPGHLRDGAAALAVQRALGVERIRVSRTHAKFVLVAGGSWKLSIRTSANLNRNRRTEIWEIDDDARIFEWLDGWVRELWRSPAGLAVEDAAAVLHPDDPEPGDSDEDPDWLGEFG